MHESYVFVNDVYWGEIDIAHTKMTSSMMFLWKCDFIFEWTLRRESRSIVLPGMNLETACTEEVEDIIQFQDFAKHIDADYVLSGVTRVAERFQRGIKPEIALKCAFSMCT